MLKADFNPDTGIIPARCFFNFASYFIFSNRTGNSSSCTLAGYEALWVYFISRSLGCATGCNVAWCAANASRCLAAAGRPTCGASARRDTRRRLDTRRRPRWPMRTRCARSCGRRLLIFAARIVNKGRLMSMAMYKRVWLLSGCCAAAKSQHNTKYTRGPAGGVRASAQQLSRAWGAVSMAMYMCV